ncbi:DNA polymerase subunit beta [Candidatus Woesearchaeota archaeon]|nr:MAG: DNA polymerase subunit beta [Candidatus Woesearchaeota archaeon]
MNFEKILSTKERIKILRKVIFKESKFGVNEIAKEVKVSKGLVSKYFEILTKEKILGKKNRKYYVQNNIFVKSLKIMFNLTSIHPKIFKKYKFVKAVGIYGSCPKGTNTENSDVDVWIKVEKLNQKKIPKLTSELRKQVENVKILLFDDKKLEILKKEDPLFYHSLHFGSVLIYGKESEV